MHKVLIVGGGVAGLEALAALRSLLGSDRLEITVIEPAAEYTTQALSVQVPFARPSPRRYGLDMICADHTAVWVQDSIAEVSWDTVRTASGNVLAFDSLVLAVGAHRERAFREATTFRDLRDAERVHGMIQDLEGGYLRRFALIVPPGVTWTLPLYELALQTAERADSLCLDRARVTLVTPEARPLERFGPTVSAAIRAALDAAGVTFIGSTEVTDIVGGTAFAGDREIVEAQRVIALARLHGPRITGVKTDPDGFIPSDAYARVPAMRGVYAVGDASSQPIKQGGVGAQQADTAATHIAMRAGADITPTPFEPVLRAKLLTGSQSLYLRRAAGDSSGTVCEHTLWWPPTKLVAPHLAAYLEHIDHGARGLPPHPVATLLHAEGDPAGGIDVLGG